MEILTRKEQINQRTILVENQELFIRGRKNLKYMGIKKTKSGKEFHHWKSIDLITDNYFIDEGGNLFRHWKDGKICSQEEYKNRINRNRERANIRRTQQ